MTNDVTLYHIPFHLHEWAVTQADEAIDEYLSTYARHLNWSMRWQHWVDTTECQVTWGGPVPIDIEDGVADIILEQFNLTNMEVERKTPEELAADMGNQSSSEEEEDEEDEDGDDDEWETDED